MKKIFWTKEKLHSISYSDEQKNAIDEALAEITNDDDNDDNYSRSSDIVQRGAQTFIIFGDIARELLPFDEAEDERARFEYLPVIIDGQMIERSPDEGSGGMLYLVRCTHRRGHPYAGKWMHSYISTGWLYYYELDLTTDEINRRILDEIDSGAIKPVGWA